MGGLKRVLALLGLLVACFFLVQALVFPLTATLDLEKPEWSSPSFTDGLKKTVARVAP